jgi:hypothetical protein
MHPRDKDNCRRITSSGLPLHRRGSAIDLDPRRISLSFSQNRGIEHWWAGAGATRSRANKTEYKVLARLLLPLPSSFWLLSLCSRRGPCKVGGGGGGRPGFCSRRARPTRISRPSLSLSPPTPRPSQRYLGRGIYQRPRAAGRGYASAGLHLQDKDARAKQAGKEAPRKLNGPAPRLALIRRIGDRD